MGFSSGAIVAMAVVGLVALLLLVGFVQWLLGLRQRVIDRELRRLNIEAERAWIERHGQPWERSNGDAPEG